MTKYAMLLASSSSSLFTVKIEKIHEEGKGLDFGCEEKGLQPQTATAQHSLFLESAA